MNIKKNEINGNVLEKIKLSTNELHLMLRKQRENTQSARYT